MKKIFSLLSVFSLMLCLWAISSPDAMAQGIESNEDSTPNLETASITLASLGIEGDIILQGPWDSYEIRFIPPSSWSLMPGASLLLNFNKPNVSQDNNAITETGGTIQVSLNAHLISTVFVDQLSDQPLLIQIPPDALITQRTDGRHELRFFLDASIDCLYPHLSNVGIKSDSILYLPHEVVAPSTDLTLLPRPIYQRGSFQPEKAALVVSDQPSAQELQAAMTVAAGFGRMSSGNLVLPLVTMSTLTEEDRDTSHLIVVGKPAGLAMLKEINFISPISSGDENMLNVQLNDGLIEMVVSPWNPSRVVLYVGGNTDSGVVKAAEALSYGIIQPGERLSQSLISAINPDQINPNTTVDRTLADLGYTSSSVTGIGTSYLEYHFIIPPGQVPGLDPYFNLIYTHSAFIDPARSGLVIELNNQRIGSAVFNEENIQQVNSLVVNLPSDALQQGDNKLVVQADLRPRDLCSDFISSNLWFNAFSTSLIHMPLVPAQTGTSSVRVDLSRYPFPFSSDPTLRNLGFVLTGPTSWNIAAQIASDLGQDAYGQILSPSVALAHAVTDNFRKSHDLIVIGRASEIPLIAEMSDAMPAPFDPGSDQASEQSQPITYRLPEGASMGYLEIFSSPWNPNNTVLTVLGSSIEGVLWAGNALFDPKLRSTLAGNFSVINRTQVQTADTQMGFSTNLSATAMPGGEVVMSGAPPLLDYSPAPGLPNWLLPMILVTFLLTVVFIGFLLLRGMKKIGKFSGKQDTN